jgi:anti-sigma regulatory factor (Ser/Thr protein kinase)
MRPAAYERLELGATLDAPAAARTTARDVLGPRLATRPAGDMLVLVTELVTNAVRHAGLGPTDTIVVHLAAAESVVRVEVWDPGAGFEPPAQRDPDSTGGFGLLLLRTLPDRWGLVTGAPGTCAWFEFG